MGSERPSVEVELRCRSLRTARDQKVEKLDPKFLESTACMLEAKDAEIARLRAALETERTVLHQLVEGSATSTFIRIGMQGVIERIDAALAPRKEV